MKKYKTVSATEMKNRFGDYLGEVLRKRQPILIERHGKSVAVLIEVEEWEKKNVSLHQKIEAVEDPWLMSLRKVHKRIEGRHPHLSQFSAVELIHKIRKEVIK